MKKKKNKFVYFWEAKFTESCK